MNVKETILPGVYAIEPEVKPDERGWFAKIMQTSIFSAHKWRSDFQESYYSVSETNVLRGLHFQIPPADGPKLICCLSGLVHDVLLDLRRHSPTFRQHIKLKLVGDRASMVYMPEGIAHGFWVEEGPAGMLYYQCAEYSSSYDTGILWNKAGIAWPFKERPIISARDLGFLGLDEFISPFV
jgi:dTDP-4-dehydrorhamnose 3,5-epimerase